MAADYDHRLANLRDRRQGISTLQKSMQAQDSREALARTRMVERYERRSSNKATRYALGSMQAVDADYTAKSVAEGDRVKEQLRLGHSGVTLVDFRYQGSVPLDVHIRGVSDIDLLLLRNDFLTYDGSGAGAGTYAGWGGKDATTLLWELRTSSEDILMDAYPRVTVDTSGAKSISLEGGSLRRKVDVVPAHWHDSSAYQSSRQQKDRGVFILDKHAGTRPYNLPFLHMHQINTKEGQTRFGAKKVIRLLKNLRSDSDYSDSIKLSSYDIAGVVWHFDNAGLTVAPWFELRLLEVTNSRLQSMVANKARTMALKTPDDTRCVIDSEAKFNGLILLSFEVGQLCEVVAKEISPLLIPMPNTVQKSLQDAYIP